MARAQAIAAEQGGSVLVTDDPVAAVAGADVVTTDELDLFVDALPGLLDAATATASASAKDDR